MTNFGIIDLGSNSVKISIYDMDSKKYLYRGKISVKLSESMNNDMIIQNEPINRTIDALLKISALMKKFEVGNVVAIATAALRKAKNQREVVETIKNRTGIEVKVIDGITEANLDFLGVIGKTEISDAVILDTGGGSIEIIGAKSGDLYKAESIQIGSRGIKEMFFLNGENDESKALAKAKVEEMFNNIKWLDEFLGYPIIGIGGSNRTVAKVCAEEEEGLIEKYEVPREKVFEIFEKIGKTKIEDRGNIKGITKDRTDIIYGGLIPLTVLMEKLKSDKLVVTDAGLTDGIIEKIKEKF